MFKIARALALCAAILFAPAVIAVSATALALSAKDVKPADLVCVALPIARAINNDIPPSQGSALEWNGEYAKRFFSFFNLYDVGSVDVVLFRRFPSGAATFALGSTFKGQACTHPKFKLSAKDAARVIAIVYSAKS